MCYRIPSALSADLGITFTLIYTTFMDVTNYIDYLNSLFLKHVSLEDSFSTFSGFKCYARKREMIFFLLSLGSTGSYFHVDIRTKYTTGSSMLLDFIRTTTSILK
jgi:hypothetical protein